MKIKEILCVVGVMLYFDDVAFGSSFRCVEHYPDDEGPSSRKRKAEPVVETVSQKESKQLFKLETTLVQALVPSNSDSAFLEAIKKGDTSLIERQIQENPELINQANRSLLPLTVAVFYNLLDVVKLLIDNGAVVDADVYSETPLMTAAYMGHESIVRLLIDSDADVTKEYQHGITAYDMAVMKERDFSSILFFVRGAL